MRQIRTAHAVVVAEELLIAHAIASTIAARSVPDVIAVESLERARRTLRGHGDEVVVWLGESLDDGAADAVSGLRRAAPHAAVCVLVLRAEPRPLRRLLRGGAGALAVLLRAPRLDVGDLLASAEEALSGKSSLDSRVLGELVNRSSKRGDAFESLTDSELQILQFVSLGLRNSEIARRLWKSDKAIEKRVGTMFSKLGLAAGSAPHLDRRVAAARMFLSRFPDAMAEPAPVADVAEPVDASA